MRKVLVATLFLHFIVACTSDLEKAKQLGFSSVSEMTSLNEMGYKSYADFEKIHPFVTADTSTTKFAGAELGKTALKYSEKIVTVELPQMYKTNKDVYIETSWSDENSIKRIIFNCKLSKAEKVKLGNVDCSSTEEDLKAMKLKTLCDVYAEESPEKPYFYVKDKSFYSTNSEGKVQWLGIASDDHFEKDWTGGEVPSKLIACSAVASWTANAANGGFKNIYEMDEAGKQGFKTANEWKMELGKKKFRKKYNDATNSLEKALVVNVSTSKDFREFKDNGGLNVLNSWYGYSVSLMELENRDGVLTFIHLTVDSDYKHPEKPATFNNLKKELLDECGATWDSKGRSDAYWANSDFSLCEISEASRGGYNIVVSIKSKN